MHGGGGDYSNIATASRCLVFLKLGMHAFPMGPAVGGFQFIRVGTREARPPQYINHQPPPPPPPPMLELSKL